MAKTQIRFFILLPLFARILRDISNLLNYSQKMRRVKKDIICVLKIQDTPCFYTTQAKNGYPMKKDFVYFQKLFPMATAIGNFHTISRYFLRGCLFTKYREEMYFSIPLINIQNTKTLLFGYPDNFCLCKRKAKCLVFSKYTFY